MSVGVDSKDLPPREDEVPYHVMAFIRREDLQFNRRDPDCNDFDMPFYTLRDKIIGHFLRTGQLCNQC